MFWILLFTCGDANVVFDQSELLRLTEEDSYRTQILGTLKPEQQDILLLKLAVQNPTLATKFCREVNGRGAKEKCKQVIGRPHLQLTKPQIVDGQQ